MSKVTTPAAAGKPAITAAGIVDALVDIRDELARGVKPVFVIPKVWALVGRVEEAADSLAAARMDALLAELGRRIPPIAGGAPDDREEIDPEFTADPAGWPAWTNAHRWVPNFDGPTPAEVLAASAPTWEPSDAEWDEMYAASAPGLSEADHLAVHGCC